MFLKRQKPQLMAKKAPGSLAKIVVLFASLVSFPSTTAYCMNLTKSLN